MTTRLTHNREIRCPMDGDLLDNHTNEDLIECDRLATTYYEIAEALSVSPIRIHSSWTYRLPERYQA